MVLLKDKITKMQVTIIKKAKMVAPKGNCLFFIDDFDGEVTK